ncbi:helix-turn-helix transcriptional regulator [Spirosoma validum]|uniref:WYL domain-containing protein n=1 Tax=Spirosoma validum TaxID=2771355 RepID=A0A927GGV9_9BACT|nr:WYL domain-containing protein [Spirosoma validum]MBD2757103.1 WYL domain-containing protein [Spirosoma validum]
MATNKNASFRYRVLNECFRDGSRRWTIERLIDHVSSELNAHFGINKGISDRQLKEDIHIMRSLPPRGFDAPIICQEGVYFYYDLEFSIEKKALNTEDIRSLTEAITLLKQFRGLPHFQEIEAIVTKIEGKAITNDPDETIVSFENTRLVRGYEYLEPLYQAIRTEQVSRITYRAFQASVDEVFTFHPYYLKEYRQRWYVFGWVSEKDTVYNLALDRIQTIESTKKLFKANKHFNPTTYFNDIVGVTRPANKDIETVLLQVDVNTAPYLETRPIHHSQQIHSANETGVTFQYKLIPNYEFISEVLRLGANAQLLSPDSLRNDIAKQIAVLNEKYQDQLEQ